MLLLDFNIMVEENKQDQVLPKLRVYFTKSNFFRVVHADGLVGSVTPKRDIFISFYNERIPIPDSIVYELSPKGAVISEVESERITTTKGVIREMEVGVVLDLADARSLIDWLRQMVGEAEVNFEDVEEVKDNV